MPVGKGLQRAGGLAGAVPRMVRPSVAPSEMLLSVMSVLLFLRKQCTVCGSPFNGEPGSLCPSKTCCSAWYANLADANTEALGLTGSHARGDAGAHSDVDLWHFVHQLPDDPFAAYTLRMLQGHLVSISVRRLAEEAALMRAPLTAIAVVPGFRQMRILHDPQGSLAQVVEAARSLSGQRCSRSPPNTPVTIFTATPKRSASSSVRWRSATRAWRSSG